MVVTVIQYMRPNGRTVETSTELPDTMRPFYETMLRRGWHFSAEVLTTGHISLTIEDRVKELDVAGRIVVNGPAVQCALEELLRLACSPVSGKQKGKELNYGASSC